MKKETLLIIFGGHNTEYYASCDSVGGMLNHLDQDKFDLLKLGVTEKGDWLLTDADAKEISDGISWLKRKNNRKAVITPFRNRGTLTVFQDGKTEEIPVDCVFPLISGYGGEDGCIQGLLELANLPYVGSGVAASACAMDKHITRLFAQQCGLLQPRCLVLTDEEYGKTEGLLTEKINFGYPLFVKPASQGSSVGLCRVDRPEELDAAVTQAFRYEHKILIEEGILGKEIKVAVLGNDRLEIGAICALTLPEGTVNDYVTKHISFASKKKIPADLKPELEQEIKRQAKAIYRVLGCRGFARVDFFLDESETLFFNEINTVPGIGAHSIFSVMFEKKGMCLREVLTRLVRLGQEEAEKKQELRLEAFVQEDH